MTLEYCNLVVVTPQQQDVLLGRGTGPNEHQGNRFFRLQAKQRKEEYATCTSRGGKDQLVMDVIQAVWAKGGRFLKKRVKGRNDNEPEDFAVYEVAEEDTVLEKTRQVFQYFRRGATRTDSVSASVAEIGDNVSSSTQTHGPVSDPDSQLSECRVGATMANDHHIYPTSLEDDLQARIAAYQLASYSRQQGTFADGRFAVLPHRQPISLTDMRASAQMAHLNSVHDYPIGSLPYAYCLSSNSSPEFSLYLAALTALDQNLFSLSRDQVGWRHSNLESILSAVPPFSTMPPFLDSIQDSRVGVNRGSYFPNPFNTTIRYPRGPSFG